MSVYMQGRMPTKASQCCCEGICQERMVGWHWGCTRPQTAGGKRKKKTSYLHNGCCSLSWRRFLPPPNLAIGLTLHGWGKTNQLSMWRLLSSGRNSAFPPAPAGSSALEVELTSFCPRWNALAAQAHRSEGEKHLSSWLIPQLEQVRGKSIIPSFACKGQESLIKKGDNTGFSLGKRKVSCKAKLLSLLWRLHGTLLLGCELSSPHWDLYIPWLSRFLGSAVIAGRGCHKEGEFSRTHAV